MKTLLSKESLQKGSLAIGGMVVGAIVGIAVQAGVESTGILGPSIDELLEEQEANFDAMSARLQEIRTQADDPAVRKSLGELGKLLARQNELQNRATAEITALSNQVANLRQQSLEEQGFASGADVWLGVGESITVGDTNHVLGVVRMWSNTADVNFNGTKSRMSVGDLVSVEGLDCAVFLKQGRRAEDGRAGFDVTCG
jgi:hypothetical protein